MNTDRYNVAEDEDYEPGSNPQILKNYLVYNCASFQ